MTCARVAILASIIAAACSAALGADDESVARFARGHGCHYCDLSGADLNVSGVRSFQETNFSRALLFNADLQWANLVGANLTGANLSGSDLTKADLRYANFTDAILNATEAKPIVMRGAQLEFANFTRASLVSADLDGAQFYTTDLTDADLSLTTLREARFEPVAVPPASHLRAVRGLDTLQWTSSSSGLVLLRNTFKNAGMREQEREVTVSIMRSHRKNIGGIEGALMLALFEWTTNWGLSPTRPIKILFALILLFGLAYTIPIAVPSRYGSIWRVWDRERIMRAFGSDDPERVLGRGAMLPVYGLAFSLLSALHFGWRDLNLGTWVARLNPYEFSLRGTGWVRTISGFQSVVSIYLIAIAILTYFGRPFEW